MGLFDIFKKKNKNENKTTSVDVALVDSITSRVLDGIAEFDLGVFKASKDNISLMGEYDYALKNGCQLSEDEFVASLIELINDFTSKFSNHKTAFKNYILLRLLYDVYTTGSFGGGYFTSNEISQEECEAICEKVITKEIEIELDNYLENGLTYNSTFNAEEFIRINLPFFDYDAFMSAIKCEYITLSFNYNKSLDKLELDMSLQFSDKHISFYCGAYDNFDESLLPRDWHNF